MNLSFFKKRAVLAIGTILILVGLVCYSWPSPEMPEEPTEPNWDAAISPSERQAMIDRHQTKLGIYLDEYNEYEAKLESGQALRFTSVWFLWVGVAVFFWSTAFPPERKAVMS